MSDLQCCICYEKLPSKNAICPGNLPGAMGFTKFSPGPCKSTPEQRAEVEKRRREAYALEHPTPDKGPL
jgi:hypothetical protein